MSEMIRRIAQVLHDFDLDGASSLYDEETDKAAHAVLTAMREPTEAMLNNKHAMIAIGFGGILQDAWQAMIDAALGKEKEE
jgi:hypothetical protein